MTVNRQVNYPCYARKFDVHEALEMKPEHERQLLNNQLLAHSRVHRRLVGLRATPT